MLLKKKSGFRLGSVILDDCMSEKIGLYRSLEFVKHYLMDDDSHSKDSIENNDATRTWHVVGRVWLIHRVLHLYVKGVIGPMSSNVADHVTTLYTLFEVPLISYLSSSSSFSTKDSNHALVRKMQLTDSWHIKALGKVFLYVLVFTRQRTFMHLKRLQLDDNQRVLRRHQLWTARVVTPSKTLCFKNLH